MLLLTRHGLRLALHASLMAPWLVLAQQAVDVIIQDYRFQPSEIRVVEGSVVRWVNKEKRTSHSVVFAAELGGESERFFPDEHWQKRFDIVGTFPYQCDPHPEMKGTVIVLPR